MDRPCYPRRCVAEQAIEVPPHRLLDLLAAHATAAAIVSITAATATGLVSGSFALAG
jgi:hypothetical protein